MIGRYPDFDVLDAADTWDDATAGRSCSPGWSRPARCASSRAAEEPTLRAFCDIVHGPGRRAAGAGGRDGRREAGRRAARRLPLRRHARRPRHLAAGPARPRPHRAPGATGAALRRTARAERSGERSSGEFAQGTARRRPVGRAERDAGVVGGACAPSWPAFYSHPWAWNEIGFGGPAYPRGYMRLRPGERAGEPFERAARPATDPVRVRSRTGRADGRRAGAGVLKGAVGPRDNDSRFLLDVHRRDLPGEDDHAPLRRRRRGRPGDRRRRRGRLGAGAAAGPRAAGAS